MVISRRRRAAPALALALLLAALTGCSGSGTPAATPTAPGVGGLLRDVQKARAAQATEGQDLSRAANSAP
jgi:hypothetical protein